MVLTLAIAHLFGLSYLSQVNLRSNGLVQLPEDLFRTNYNLKLLDLSFNQIVQIPSLPVSLETLDLRNNNIFNISNGAFIRLSYLLEVNLGSNSLVQLPENAFPISLKRLDLRNNNLADLSNSSFVGLSHLSQVNLRSNGLVQLPEDILETNYNLQLLDLSFNQISQIPSLPHSLETLDLRNNNIVNINNSSFLGVSDLYMLDLSQNQIREFTLNDMPNIRGNLNLSSNDLSIISFKLKPNLNFVDLTNNNLASLEISGLKEYRYAHGSGDIYVAGNGDPFQCMCNLEVRDSDASFTYDNRNDAQYRIRNITSLNCSSVHNLATGGIIEISIGTFMCKTPCHGSCTCYHWNYIDNINIVNCLNAGLTSVPVNISVSCTILDLSANTLESLVPGNFDGLSHLKELYLNSCNLTEIQEGTFRELYNLKKLDLRNNRILLVNSDIFDGVNGLTSLDLSSNKICVLSENTFESLNKLKDLDLSGNELETISSSDLDSLYKLASLKLSNNPWTCNCSFLEHLVQLSTKLNVLLVDKNFIICLTANKTELHMTKINIKEFCPNKHPDNSDTADTLVAITVSTASGVLVVAVICLVLWYKNRKVLKVCCFVHFGWKFGSVPNGEQDKPYDAFVSFSSLDDAFIIRELMPHLEAPCQGQLGYKLCVHFRDFPVGESIAAAILGAVKDSRRVIMILSDNFLTSEWCNFEFQAAHQQLLKEKKNRIIMVLLHDINSDLLDKHLRRFLSTRTYVKYGDPLFWNKIENAMPERKPANEDNLDVNNIDY